MKNIFSVGQINRYVKNMFTQDFILQKIYVKGEVSNCKYHTSGHIYFSLKDETGVLSCVMFAGHRRGLAFRMKDGDRVVVGGAVDVYERDGRYQLYAKEITLEGAGALYERFLALKAELEEMGMFAEEYKQPIPHYIHRLGVVTAPTAVILVMVNGKLRELQKRLKSDCTLEFVTTKDHIGFETYKRSVCLVLLRAIYDVAGRENVDKVMIHYSVGNGYYFTMEGKAALDQDFLDKVKVQMHKLAVECTPIGKRSVNTDEAVALFHKHRMYDKEKLFRFRRVSKVNIYNIGYYDDYFYGYMADHAGYVQYFDLKLYDEGFVLELPRHDDRSCDFLFFCFNVRGWYRHISFLLIFIIEKRTLKSQSPQER